MEYEEYIYTEEDLEREEWYGSEGPEIEELPKINIADQLEILIVTGQLLRF